MHIKQSCAYDLLVPTSMGLRFCPKDGQPIETANEMTLQVTSAETNAVSVPASLGKRVKVLTALIEDSPISEMIKRDLNRRNMSVEAKVFDQGGPWGLRHQINFADSGYGERGPRVTNDRAGEVGRLLSEKYFDLDEIFDKQGIKILHLTGLFLALSTETAALCLALLKKAKQCGTLVSFDVNYRASFWENRETELKKIFHEVASQADILIGADGLVDAGMSKSIDLEADGYLEAFKKNIEAIHEKFNKVKMIVSTMRQVENANAHLWGGMIWHRNVWEVIEPKRIHVLDRIGGGDGFAGGLLNGILNGWDAQKCLQFAWASGAFTSTVLTDYAQPINEAQIWDVWQGNVRVQR